jgi:type I restriction enzyme S subunit
MQQDFHPDLLAEIPVPIVSDDEAMAIDLLVRDSFQKYDDAIDCEDQARTLVERAIEEGGR